MELWQKARISCKKWLGLRGSKSESMSLNDGKISPNRIKQWIIITIYFEQCKENTPHKRNCKHFRFGFFNAEWLKRIITLALVCVINYYADERKERKKIVYVRAHKYSSRSTEKVVIINMISNEWLLFKACSHLIYSFKYQGQQMRW